MGRRWRLRVFWAAVIFGVLLLALIGTVAQVLGARRRPNVWRDRGPLERAPFPALR